MKNNKSLKTYVIRHKKTKELFIAPSGKSSWRSAGAAKNAFAQMNSRFALLSGLTLVEDGLDWQRNPRFRAPLFKEQDVYEIVELSHEIENRLVQAERLLMECLGRLTSSTLTEDILDFLGEKDADN